MVDALWRGEALGTLLWALELVEMPPYDQAFASAEVVEIDPSAAELRPADQLGQEHQSARLWLWRARTGDLAESGELELPDRFSTVDQLVAATAMRGHERGVLPPPLRGDFRAFGKIYRHLSPVERAEAHAIALERHHALSWLCASGTAWESVPLDT